MRNVNRSQERDEGGDRIANCSFGNEAYGAPDTAYGNNTRQSLLQSLHS